MHQPLHAILVRVLALPSVVLTSPVDLDCQTAPLHQYHPSCRCRLLPLLRNSRPTPRSMAPAHLVQTTTTKTLLPLLDSLLEAQQWAVASPAPAVCDRKEWYDLSRRLSQRRKSMKRSARRSLDDKLTDQVKVNLSSGRVAGLRRHHRPDLGLLVLFNDESLPMAIPGQCNLQ